MDAYIAGCPARAQAMLEAIRRAVQKAVPEAEESFGYGMPAFRFHGPLVYFGAFQGHCSLFGASGTLRTTFAKELAPYAGGKGTIQFPLDEAVPVALVRKIAKHRAKENLAKAATKRAKPRRRASSGR